MLGRRGGGKVEKELKRRDPGKSRTVGVDIKMRNSPLRIRPANNDGSAFRQLGQLHRVQRGLQRGSTSKREGYVQVSGRMGEGGNVSAYKGASANSKVRSRNTGEIGRGRVGMKGGRLDKTKGGRKKRATWTTSQQHLNLGKG